MPNIAASVEFYLAITTLVIGASHALRPGDWCEAFRRLHGWGRLGAFLYGGLGLFTGALIVAGHGSWAWPGTIVTGLGWLLIAKSCICFLLPETALRSMERGPRSPRGFVLAGLACLVFSGWTWYCLWSGEPSK